MARSFDSILSWLLVPHLIAQTGSKLPAQQRASSAVRFEVCDGEDNLPVPNARVTIVSWRNESGIQKKTEIDSLTDENGAVVFTKAKGEKVAISVEA